MKPLPELTAAVGYALSRLAATTTVAHQLALLGAPPEELREPVARLDLSALAEAVTALQAALEPAPAEEPVHVHLELKELCDALDACGARLRLGTGTIALDCPEPADVHEAHPVVLEVLPQSRPPSLAEIEAAERSLRIAEYAVPLAEVEDEIEAASRATGIPLPKAVRS